MSHRLKTALLFFAAVLQVPAWSQPLRWIGQASQDGSPYSFLPEGASSASVPLIATALHGTGSAFGPGGYTGGAMNTFTGQSGYSVPVTSMSVRGRIGYTFTLDYSGNTRDASRDDNKTSPTGWVGLGWSMQAPYIARSHKGSFGTQDDVLWAHLGPLGSGQLIRGASGKFYLANNPYLTFTPDSATNGDFAGQFESWTLIQQDGTRWVFGDRNGTESNSERIMRHLDGPVRVSPYAMDNANTKPFIYRWDVRYMTDAEQQNRLFFEYQKTNAPLFGGPANYTQESHLSFVRYQDRGNQDVHRVNFLLLNKGATEYSLPASNLSLSEPEPVETKYLDRIQTYHGGTMTLDQILTYQLVGTGRYQKRLLANIATWSQILAGSSTREQAPGWKFTYEAAAKNYALSKVDKPDGGQSEFQYVTPALGAEASQPAYDDAANRLKDGAGAVVSFPSATNWSNLSSCNERFCFLVAKDGDKVGGKIFLEVRTNRGNYFEDAALYRLQYTSSSTSVPSNWKWVANGEYFVVYNAHDKTAYVHEWSGNSWSLKVTADFGPVAGSASVPLSIHPARNYFVAYQKSSTLNKVWVYLKRGTAWARLNGTTPCDISNDGNYGETVKTAGTGCLEFNAGLKVAVAEGFFALMHEPTDILFAYALNKAGAFAEVSGKFLNFGDGIQHSTYPNNWQQDISAINMGSDYFTVHSVSSTTQQRFDAIHFDGYNFRRVATSGWEAGATGDMVTALERDYFLQANHNTRLIHHWIRTGITGGFTFTKAQVRSDLGARSAMRLSLRAFPEAFAVEYGRTGEDVGGIPVPIMSGSDFASWLYQVDFTATGGFRDRSGDLAYSLSGVNSRLFGLSYSPDNFVGGVTMRSSSAQGTLCPVGGTCTPYFATKKVRRWAEAANAFLFQPTAVPMPTGTSLNKYIVFSAARSGQISLFDQTTSSVKYRLFAWDGDDFSGAPAGFVVVDRYIEHSGVNTTGPGMSPDIIQAYSYDAANAEFNTHLQAPMFSKVTIRKPGSDGTDNGRSEHLFNLDGRNNRLTGKLRLLNGVGREVAGFGSDGKLVSKTRSVFSKGGTSLSLPGDWPACVSVARMDSVTAEERRPNGSGRINRTSYHKFNAVNGLPQFDKQFDGTDWRLAQSIYNNLGLRLQNIQFAFPQASEPTAAALEAAPADAPFNTTSATSSSRVEYDPANPYYKLKDWVWRDVDETLTDADIRGGKEPVWNLNENWYMGAEITKRTPQMQVEEMRAVKDATAAGEAFTSVFLEGKRQLPVGTVFNSRLDNSAILMAENADASGLSGLDINNRWVNNGASYTTARAHTGRYAFKVVDNLGPTIRIYVRDVRRDKIGYKVSAWINSPESSPVQGALQVSLHRADGTQVSTFPAQFAPMDESAEYAGLFNYWVRWEVRITHEEMIANTLFNGANDYVQISVGTGSPTGDVSRVAYVDDIVCLPHNASYTLSTSDQRGFTTSTTDNFGKVTYPETNYLGSTLGVRDYRFRMFDAGASHGMGENQ